MARRAVRLRRVRRSPYPCSGRRVVCHPMAQRRHGCLYRSLTKRTTEMQKPIFILISAIAFATCGANAQLQESDQEHEQEKVKYTCPMHPEVVKDHPGECPKCGMTLVPIKPGRKRPTSNSERIREQAAQRSTSNETHPAHASSSTHEMQMAMQSSVNLADPMSRESSGTSWVPDSTPMYGKMFMFDDDMLMLHGAIFPRYTNVSPRRGDDRIDAPKWVMAMFSRSF